MISLICCKIYSVPRIFYFAYFWAGSATLTLVTFLRQNDFCGIRRFSNQNRQRKLTIKCTTKCTFGKGTGDKIHLVVHLIVCFNCQNDEFCKSQTISKTKQFSRVRVPYFRTVLLGTNQCCRLIVAIICKKQNGQSHTAARYCRIATLFCVRK